MLMTEDAIVELIELTLRATTRGDWDGARLHANRLFVGGDGDDYFVYTCGLIGVVIEQLPKPCCAEHQMVSFGLARVGDDGTVDTGELFGGLTPDMEASYPEMVAYLRMVTASMVDDQDAALAVFAAAMESGLGPAVMDRALATATQTVQALRASKAAMN